MSGQIEMPKYKSHKEVWALKIKSVDATTITPEDKGYAPFEVSEQYIAKHDPKAGGYYVMYEDGYASFSPSDAFDGGYTRVIAAPTPSTAAPAKRCEHCDGTGDVHSIDGEWRGRCSCGAGAYEASTPAPAMDDLQMLIQKLAHSLRKAAPDNALSDQAMDYLKRVGLVGSPLRDGEQS